MANRPVFVPKTEGPALVEIVNVDFAWSAGLSIVQKQKSIAALHDSFRQRFPQARVLEVSSKSAAELGRKLSAFNMGVTSRNGQFISVESLFQSSKVFTSATGIQGPFRELMLLSPKEAKQSELLKNAGQLKHFSYCPSEQREAEIWALEPKSAFYDWLYLNALNIVPWKEELLAYSAFTDIEFNPVRSINCQAYSVALWCALRMRGLVCDAIPPRDAFIDLITKFTIHNTSDGDTTTMSLF
ncbi:DarT1-associated NADAR antitoxin family protein [Leclercia sp.]|uniref:DarT1-associated NADAR antitoxin family protein n=1 Tax=Leclercia sp. TaxID=1898428 RepID=UPI002FDDFF08